MERAVGNDSGQRLLELPADALARVLTTSRTARRYLTNSIYDEYLCIAIETARRLARFIILGGTSCASPPDERSHIPVPLFTAIYNSDCRKFMEIFEFPLFFFFSFFIYTNLRRPPSEDLPLVTSCFIGGKYQQPTGEGPFAPVAFSALGI